MRKTLALCAAIGALTVAASAAVIPIVRAGDVTVTATYKGKGPVDEKHKILVFLFDHPKPTGNAHRSPCKPSARTADRRNSPRSQSARST